MGRFEQISVVLPGPWEKKHQFEFWTRDNCLGKRYSSFSLDTHYMIFVLTCETVLTVN